MCRLYFKITFRNFGYEFWGKDSPICFSTFSLQCFQIAFRIPNCVSIACCDSFY